MYLYKYFSNGLHISLETLKARDTFPGHWHFFNCYAIFVFNDPLFSSYNYRILSSISTEEFNELCTELFIDQQQITFNNSDLDSLRQRLCVATRTINVMEGHIQQANLIIERFYSHIYGNDPLSSFVNPVPYDITVHFVEQNFICLRLQLAS